MAKSEDVSWDTYESEVKQDSRGLKTRCAFGAYLDGIEQDKGKTLVLASLDNTEVSVRAILKANMQRGYTGGRTSLADHRRKICVCFRESR